MSFVDLRAQIAALESEGDLVRIAEPVSSDQEITIIQHRVLEQGGPALLFENVIGSDYRLVSNLYGTTRRVERAFGRPAAAIGEEIASLAEKMMPPSLGALWESRSVLRRIASARLKERSNGPILETNFEPPRLGRLPVLKCWPLDGGPFFTLPLVHTTDPDSGVGNLGIYRMQLFGDDSTGMHWQVEKGGRVHFEKAIKKGIPLDISVALGGPPALTIAAIAPLPEGIDERLLAALILGRPLETVLRPETGHKIPARAEFVLEGTVTHGDLQHEGPFGDHLGHYSHSADFPVFRVRRLLARRDAIYPATVVGKPKQEDYFIGEALQDLTMPLLKMMRPGIRDCWAYPESGFHPLAAISVAERYPREALKHAFAVLGEGQLSLTKITMVVGEEVDVRNFERVSDAVYRNLKEDEGIHLLAPTSQDTLDFTGPAMNTGSRLILLATPSKDGPVRTGEPPAVPQAADLHPSVRGVTRLGLGFLIVQVERAADRESVREAIGKHPLASRYPFSVLVSDDVDLDDPTSILWGWFTRFDPLTDLHPNQRELDGNRLVLRLPIVIDATWKEGYRLPVAFDPEQERMVDEKWARYGIELK